MREKGIRLPPGLELVTFALHAQVGPISPDLSEQRALHLALFLH